MAIARTVRCWLLLVPLIPSMWVSIITLYYLLTNRVLRSGLHNHAIILILACGIIEEATDIIWLIHLYRTGTAISSTAAFCFAWAYLSAVCLASTTFLMAWASIERHVLIFHAHWLRTPNRRIWFHYLPLCACLLWPMVFFGITYIGLPCSVPHDYTEPGCGITWCIVDYPQLAVFDGISNAITPTFTIVGLSSALFLRVLYHRSRAQHQIDWRSYKKMVVQLLSISMLYFFLSFPPILLYTAYAVGLPSSIGADYYSDSSFFFYWIIIFTPFVSLASLPEVRVKLRRTFPFLHQSNAVRPHLMATTSIRALRTVKILPNVIR
jgi:hypothetical protein